MSTFVALLRGVNVGKAKRVPMEVLRSLLSDLGYTEVKTLLNSGNAIFQATDTSGSAHAKAVARAIWEHLAIDVPVIVKSGEQLAAIVNENPFAQVATNHSRVLVAFTQEARGLATLENIVGLVTPPEAFVVGKHAAYLHCPAGILASKAGDALVGKAGRSATTRNWATTLKLHALAGTGRATSA
jgi:uncharacterized protein (DUF1697 family)